MGQTITVIQKLYQDPLFCFSIAVAPLACLLFSWVATDSIGFSLSENKNLWQWLMLLFIFPVVEEFVFRGTVQTVLKKLYDHSFGGFSIANIITSVIFVLMHTFVYAWYQAVFILVPSLLFGYFKDRYDTLLPSTILHIWFNFSFFLIVSR